jgi:hypothetical protein
VTIKYSRLVEIMINKSILLLLKEIIEVCSVKNHVHVVSDMFNCVVIDILFKFICFKGSRSEILLIETKL